MTEEQIKQNADAYAMRVAESHIIEKRPAYVAAFNAFMSGAHSRDKEITALNDLLDVYEKKLDQLSHPWISVEDRLPRIGQSCFLANFDKRRCGYGKFCADDGMLTRWERTEGGSTKIYCLHEVTHWMPIPEPPKGGKE